MTLLFSLRNIHILSEELTMRAKKKSVQNQNSGLVAVAEVDGCKSASWPWEETVMRDVREEQ